VESLAATGRMAAIVAHELRNPLLTIRLGADSLRGMLSNTHDALEIFNEIEHGIDLLNDTVNELLDYTRVMRLELELESVRDIVEQALKTLHQKLTNITVGLELENDNTQLSVDPPKIVRALTNILTNAAEAMPDGGSLKVQSRLSRSRRLSLIVSDSGHGMDAKAMENLFQPFYTTKINGTGLGLAISKKIVEAHGGRISLKSKPGKGAIVTVTLPISLKPAEGNPQ